MNARTSLAVGLSAVVCCAALTGCGGSGGTSTGPGVGQKFFPLMAEGWLNGSAPAESSLAGKVVVVNVWAYW